MIFEILDLSKVIFSYDRKFLWTLSLSTPKTILFQENIALHTKPVKEKKRGQNYIFSLIKERKQ